MSSVEILGTRYRGSEGTYASPNSARCHIRDPTIEDPENGKHFLSREEANLKMTVVIYQISTEKSE